MPSINREQGFITELLMSEDMLTTTDNQISLKFLNGKYKNAYRFIRDHYGKYGKVPSIKIFHDKFPNLELAKIGKKCGTEESMQFWCDAIREKHKHNTIAESIEKMYETMGSEGEEVTEETYKIARTLVNMVENDIVLRDRMSVTSNTKKRKDDYKQRQKSGGMTGLPSGIEHWDKITGGSNKGELTVIMGYTGLGKLCA